MIFPLTTIATTILGLVLVAVSVQVILARRNAGVSLGHGEDETLLRRMRAQANFTEYGPMGLILLLAAESHGALYALTVIAAIAFVIGRVFHAYSLGFTDRHQFTRLYGTILTLVGLLLLVLVNLGGIILTIT